jgi:hypothetical protein
VVTPGFFEDYLNAENVLWRPYGGGEQITFNFAYNLFTLQFMKNYNQLSVERLATALKEMNIGKQGANGTAVEHLSLILEVSGFEPCQGQGLFSSYETLK